MRNRAPKTPAEQSRQTAPASSKSFTACAANYSIFKVPERFLSLGVPVIEPPSCAVRFPPFSPPQSGPGSSQVPKPRVTLSDKGAKNAKSCTFAYNFLRNNFHLTCRWVKFCTSHAKSKAPTRRGQRLFHIIRSGNTRPCIHFRSAACSSLRVRSVKAVCAASATMPPTVSTR